MYKYTIFFIDKKIILQPTVNGDITAISSKESRFHRINYESKLLELPFSLDVVSFENKDLEYFIEEIDFKLLRYIKLEVYHLLYFSKSKIKNANMSKVIAEINNKYIGLYYYKPLFTKTDAYVTIKSMSDLLLQQYLVPTNSKAHIEINSDIECDIDKAIKVLMNIKNKKKAIEYDKVNDKYCIFKNTNMYKSPYSNLTLNNQITKRYFEHLDDNEIKRLTKKLKESLKDVRNSRPRKYFPNEYIKDEDMVDFIKEQNNFSMYNWNKNKKDSYNIVINENTLEKYGFNKKKEDVNLMKKFIEDTSVKSIDYFDVEFEIDTLEKEKKERY